MNPIVIKEKKFPFYKDTFLSAIISIRNKKYLKISYDDGKTKESKFLYCIHSKLYDTNLENIMMTDKIQIQSEVSKMKTSREEIFLNKDEDFFALVSWVEGIAENGLESLLIQKTIESNTTTLPISGFIFRFLSKYYDEILDIFLENIAEECKIDGKWHEASLIANIDSVLVFIRGKHEYTDLRDDDTAARFRKIFQYGFPTEILLKSENMLKLLRNAVDEEIEILKEFFSKDELDDYIDIKPIVIDNVSLNRLKLFLYNRKSRKKLISTIYISIMVGLIFLAISKSVEDAWVKMISPIIGCSFSIIWFIAIANIVDPFPSKIACIDFENYRIIFEGRLFSTEEISAYSNGKVVTLKCFTIIVINEVGLFRMNINKFDVVFDTYPKTIDYDGTIIVGSFVTVNEFPLWLRNVFGDSFGESVTFRRPNGDEFKPFLCFAK